jgi:hypothetical protein
MRVQIVLGAKPPKIFEIYQNLATGNESENIGGYRLFGAAPKNFLDVLRKPAS